MMNIGRAEGARLRGHRHYVHDSHHKPKIPERSLQTIPPPCWTVLSPLQLLSERCDMAIVHTAVVVTAFSPGYSSLHGSCQRPKPRYCEPDGVGWPLWSRPSCHPIIFLSPTGRVLDWVARLIYRPTWYEPARPFDGLARYAVPAGERQSAAGCCCHGTTLFYCARSCVLAPHLLFASPLNGSA